jgi:butyrate kinase
MDACGLRRRSRKEEKNKQKRRKEEADREKDMGKKILVINPGSTSTKAALFDDEKELFEKTIRHSTEEIAGFDSIADQREWRKEMIDDFLDECGFEASDLDAVTGRGGLVRPIEGGTYTVNDTLVEDLKEGIAGQHASNLGGLIARQMGDEQDIPSFIVDPTVVDELETHSRYTGNPEFPKVVVWHALNQKAVARRYAASVGKKYTDMNLIIVHMGGGLSVGAHKKGKCVDVNNCLDGDGPFSPERSGDLPSGALIRMCFSGEHTEDEVYHMVCGSGGFNAYYGTNNTIEIQKDAEAGVEKAQELFDAFTYSIAKEIGALAAALNGKVDAILLTGGIAHSNLVVEEIEEHVSWIAPVKVYAGEDEMLALAQGTLRVLNGEEDAKEY